jgi:hypothetical protein
VANKTINGKQCTILWHVNDLKRSHMERAVVEDVLKKLIEKFGKDSRLKTSRGNVLDYLGIYIDYRQKGKVKFSMQEYIMKLLGEVPRDMDGTAKTTVANYLFNISDTTKKWPHDKADLGLRTGIHFDPGPGPPVHHTPWTRLDW